MWRARGWLAFCQWFDNEWSCLNEVTYLHIYYVFLCISMLRSILRTFFSKLWFGICFISNHCWHRIQSFIILLVYKKFDRVKFCVIPTKILSLHGITQNCVKYHTSNRKECCVFILKENQNKKKKIYLGNNYWEPTNRITLVIVKKNSPEMYVLKQNYWWNVNLLLMTHAGIGNPKEFDWDIIQGGVEVSK